MRPRLAVVLAMRGLGSFGRLDEPMLERCQMTDDWVLTTASAAPEYTTMMLHQLWLGRTDMQFTWP